MIMPAVHEVILAQISNPVPETPPLADKFMKLVHYFTWFMLLSGSPRSPTPAAGSPGRNGAAAASSRRRWWRAR